MTVLVIDDDIVSRMVLMHLLDQCGMDDIVEADDGAHGWQLLQQGLRAALCFCDLRMPRLSGMELLARVRADPALASMRFVLASSSNDQASLAQASSLGADGYLLKPFGLAQVSDQLARLAVLERETERALATMRRLGISGARLLMYLGGLESQLEATQREIAPQLAIGVQTVDAASFSFARIDRLCAGCATLGLEDAAARIKALAPDLLDAPLVLAVLAGALAAVRQQGACVSRMQAPT
ncbi:MAG: response regulator [Massilia sp.]|nr:response regulator [Massilia sp.]